MNDIECPFKGAAPADMITYTVPEHLRADIAALMNARAALNPFDRDDAAEHNIRWNAGFPPTQAAIGRIEDELRSLAEASRRTHVEYYAHWQFRCPDQNTLRAEFIARGGTLTETTEEKINKPAPGRTWERGEVGHLCFAIRRNCMHAATLADALRATRAKK